MKRSSRPITLRTAQAGSTSHRPMSTWDGFIYNFLTMGVIFPWVYLQACGNFPGASIELAIAIALVCQLPISLSYSWLATVLPVSGGDYIYQSRAFGRIGFVCVMSGLVVWSLQWVAISGHLLVSLGFAPLFIILGSHFRSAPLMNLGVQIQDKTGVFVVSIVVTFLTVLILSRGLRLFVRIQKWLFILTLAAMATIALVFLLHRHDFDQALTLFLGQLGNIVPEDLRKALLQEGSVKKVVQDNLSDGFDPAHPFSLLHTLAIAPIAWTSLQWATYSVEQNTEITGADRIANQRFMLIVPVVLVAFMMILTAYFERAAAGTPFLNGLAIAFNGHVKKPFIESLFTRTFQPLPSMLAMMVSKNPVLILMIAAGSLANAFQLLCSVFIGMSRILVAMDADGVLPRLLSLGRIDQTSRSPNRALWFYGVASIPFIFLNSFSITWRLGCLAGMSLACGSVFALSSLAATHLPSKMRRLWMISEIHGISGRRIKLVGYLGFVMGAAMILPNLLAWQLWPSREVFDIMVGAIVLILFSAGVMSYILYVRIAARRPISERIGQIPREVKEFYD